MIFKQWIVGSESRIEHFANSTSNNLQMDQVDIYQSGTVVALWGVDFNDQIYFSTLPD